VLIVARPGSIHGIRLDGYRAGMTLSERLMDALVAVGHSLVSDLPMGSWTAADILQVSMVT